MRWTTSMFGMMYCTMADGRRFECYEEGTRNKVLLVFALMLIALVVMGHHVVNAPVITQFDREQAAKMSGGDE